MLGQFFVYITGIQYSVLNLPSNITFGDLRFVLQPMYQSEASLDKYAFRYTYDGRHNCIQKKIPGAQYIEYMYDTADRMIFSRDGNQRTSGKWMFYEYDNLSCLTCRAVMRRPLHHIPLLTSHPLLSMYIPPAGKPLVQRYMPILMTSVTE